MITINMILTLLGSIITILLGIIAFFFKKLLLSFDEMKSKLEIMMVEAKVQNTSCKFIHSGIEARLNAHKRSIEKLENEKH